MKSQRSLVGMTMGARKRRIAQKHHAHLSWLGAELRAMEWKAYRIGERLRPCKGCVACAYRCGHDSDCFCDLNEGPEATCRDSGALPAKRSAGGGR